MIYDHASVSYEKRALGNAGHNVITGQGPAQGKAIAPLITGSSLI